MDGIDNATSFVRFMERVWEMRSEPCDDGGIILYSNSLYDKYHHAAQTAQLFGARHTGNTQVNGENCYLYRFPNGSSVAIGYDGHWCVERKPYKYSPKPRKA